MHDWGFGEAEAAVEQFGDGAERGGAVAGQRGGQGAEFAGRVDAAGELGVHAGDGQAFGAGRGVGDGDDKGLGPGGASGHGQGKVAGGDGDGLPKEFERDREPVGQGGESLVGEGVVLGRELGAGLGDGLGGGLVAV